MAASQDHITPKTPLGASPVPGGATFRVWALTAEAVHVALQAPGQNPEDWRPGEADRLVRDGQEYGQEYGQGYWSGFFPGVEKGALYRFWTAGPGGEEYKRDPRALELELRAEPPACTVCGPNDYPWHDAGLGRDVIVVATLNESTYRDYPLPFPLGGFWHEVFNSDAYDSLPPDGGYNPWTAGNAGGVTADGPPRDGCPTSERIVIPANGLLVFARDLGDGTS